ncbi:MAG: acyl-CoA reductase [Flavobacteriaceae bacterium]|nr:acyl-CoA reductase [Flavobacteriaceae bacterium]
MSAKESNIALLNHLALEIEALLSTSSGEFDSLISRINAENPWFIASEIKRALNYWSINLRQSVVRNWLNSYKFDEKKVSKKVLLICAGNIPLVGFHDFISVILSGHHVLLKLSSKDQKLFRYLLKRLEHLDSTFSRNYTLINEPVKAFDAVIATGSANTSRYFEFYFKDYPKIIRPNKTSVSILSSSVSDQQLSLLAEDVFNYFGLGCRSITKIYLPQNFDLERLRLAFESFNELIHHHKFRNNIDYQRSINLLNKTDFIDLGHLLLIENKAVFSPMGCLYYEFYNSFEACVEQVKQNDDLQLIASDFSFENSISLGETQSPHLNQYADQIDTIEFLTEFT